MRLTLKITVVTFVGVLFVVAGYSYVTLRRQAAQFDRDNRANHQALGSTLAAAVAVAWRTGGEAAAIELLASADAEQTSIHLRWVALDGTEPDYRPPFEIPPDVMGALARGATVTFQPRLPGPDARLYTYVPIPLAAPLTGAVEISESLAGQRAFLRESIVQAVESGALIAAICALVALAFGSVLVARPVRALTAMSERIAHGDLGTRLKLRQHDELATLASAMNDMAAQLAAALAQVRHADRLATVGTLAAGVAHELGTPLNVTGGLARAIAGGEIAGAEALDAARTIEVEVRNMSATIRQLLDFARRRPPQKELVELGDVTARTLELLRPLADKKRVQLSLARDGEANAYADAGQIGQVVTNLVVNGIQAMPSGGTLSLRVENSRARPPADVGGDDREVVAISVHDEGAGIAADVLPHVFEPFFTTKGIGEGTGLGLSVSYGLVREHGGWISVASAPDRGSTFTVNLPREA